MSMDREDKQLLENLFDSLDRLFDRESRVLDVFQILYATEKAINTGSLNLSLSGYIADLGDIVRGSESEEIQRERALLVTDKLRKILNEIL